MSLTGHYMCEDKFVSQMHYIGSRCLITNTCKWPGIDDLGRNINDIMTSKQDFMKLPINSDTGGF